MDSKHLAREFRTYNLSVSSQKLHRFLRYECQFIQFDFNAELETQSQRYSPLKPAEKNTQFLVFVPLLLKQLLFSAKVIFLLCDCFDVLIEAYLCAGFLSILHYFVAPLKHHQLCMYCTDYFYYSFLLKFNSTLHNDII